jgi:serine/threonine protein kinase
MNNCPNCNNPYEAGDEVCRTCGYILPITSSIINPGEVLQTRYEIQELVHSGGMGYVYLATDKRLYDRFCIVKQIKEPIKSDAHRKKLEEEALRMAKLDHPNVAMILDHFIDSGYYFLVVERIHGKTLSEVLKERHGHLTENEVIGWAIDICDVVSYLHKEGVVHRDISPDNIMLTGEGSIKFIDFGTLRELRYIVPGGTVGMGKYGYTPPEQWQGKPEFRSDIFALGATIYYLLTGFLPLSREYTTRQTPQKEDFNPSFPPIRTRNPSVSPQFEAVLQKALSLDINERYSSVDEFGEALRNLDRVEVKAKKTPALKEKRGLPDLTKITPGVKAVRPKPVGKPRARVSLRWAWVSLGVFLFLLAGAGGIYLISSHPSTPSSATLSGTNIQPSGTSTPDTTTSSPKPSTPLPDYKLPVISQIEVAGYTGESAIITWETNEEATGQVEYGTSDSYGSISAADSEPTTSHRIELTGLQPNTTYHFRVNSTDGQENKDVSVDQDFTNWVANPGWQEYVNREYGFSIKYPSGWIEGQDLMPTQSYLAAFSTNSEVYSYDSGVIITTTRANEVISDNSIISSLRQQGYSSITVVSPPEETILADGTKAVIYEVSYWTSKGYKVHAFGLDADKDNRRIHLMVFTFGDPKFDYEKMFSQVAHTLRFTSTPVPQPTASAQPSFTANIYTNDQYSFSLQYPNEWVDRPDLIARSTYNLAAFSAPPNFIPGVSVSAFPADEPLTKEWIVKENTLLENQDPRVVSDVQEGTLADGTKCYTYKIKYVSSTMYEVVAYCLDADNGSNRIHIWVYTIDAYVPYDENLFSEIAHTLRFIE